MRTVELTRDEAELLVDLIDGCRGSETMFDDGRLFSLSETIRHKFGMITYEQHLEYIKGPIAD